MVVMLNIKNDNMVVNIIRLGFDSTNSPGILQFASTNYSRDCRHLEANKENRNRKNLGSNDDSSFRPFFCIPGLERQRSVVQVLVLKLCCVVLPFVVVVNNNYVVEDQHFTNHMISS
jgi:hypothetical protein